METFFTVFKVFIVGVFFLGYVVPEDRVFLWAFPAGWAVGTIIAELFFEWRKPKLVMTKVFDSNNVPPEVKEKMDELTKLLESTLPKKQKCDDPHCPNCWGLADEKRY